MLSGGGAGGLYYPSEDLFRRHSSSAAPAPLDEAEEEEGDEEVLVDSRRQSVPTPSPRVRSRQQQRRRRKNNMVLFASSEGNKGQQQQQQGNRSQESGGDQMASGQQQHHRSRISSVASRCGSIDSSNSGSNNSSGGSGGEHGGSGGLPAAKSNYRIMFLGACKTGKTSIIRQFLYDKYTSTYKATAVEDMYRGEFDIHGQQVGFDIQDVAGSYVYEFPGMRNVSLASADAFVLVFALDDADSWEEVSRLRDMIYEAKSDVPNGDRVPIVVVGNKCELAEHDEKILQDSPEATVVFDWENGYVESSAKERRNINKIFKELLVQAKAYYDFTLPQLATANALVVGEHGAGGGGGGNVAPTSPVPPRRASASAGANDSMRRRQSLPAVPGTMRLFSVDEEDHSPHLLGVATSHTRSKSPLHAMINRMRHGGGGGNSDLDGDVFSDGSTPPGSGSHTPTSKKAGGKRRSSLAALRRDSCKIS